MGERVTGGCGKGREGGEKPRGTQWAIDRTSEGVQLFDYHIDGTLTIYLNTGK